MARQSVGEEVRFQVRPDVILVGGERTGTPRSVQHTSDHLSYKSNHRGGKSTVTSQSQLTMSPYPDTGHTDSEVSTRKRHPRLRPRANNQGKINRMLIGV